MATAKKKSTKKSKKVQNSRIFFALDKSGSMSMIRNDAIGGFNTFLSGQKELPGKAKFTLAYFDTHFRVVHDGVDINEVPELSHSTYQPTGGTALYDAIAKIILENKGKGKKGEKTIFAILTDGEENSSIEFRGHHGFQKVNELIKEAQEEHGWEIIFVGANLDAEKVGTSLGIKASNVTSYDYNAKGVQDVFVAVNMAASSMRGIDRSYACASGAIETLTSDTIDMKKLYSDFKANATILPDSDKK